MSPDPVLKSFQYKYMLKFTSSSPPWLDQAAQFQPHTRRSVVLASTTSCLMASFISMALRLCCLLVLLSTISLVASLDLQADSDTSLELVPEISGGDSLQVLAGESRGTSTNSYRRLLQATICRGTDISISQSQTGTYNGIPKFTVNIVNTCYSSCYPWNVHLYCGSFASAILVNPNTFKRLAVNDCLVKNGQGLVQGSVLSFTYANSAKYPLSFRSMQWCS